MNVKAAPIVAHWVGQRSTELKSMRAQRTRTRQPAAGKGPLPRCKYRLVRDPAPSLRRCRLPASTSTSVNGKGETIGIIELGGGFTTSDLSTYFSGLKISPAPTVVAVSVDGAQNQPTGDTNGPDTEVMLDIEV